MKRGAWITIGVLTVVLLGSIIFVITRPEPANPPTQQANDLPLTSEPATQPSNAPSQPGAFIPYSEEAFNQAAQRRILFFHAAWCPQCRALEQSIVQNGVPSGMTILKVDYDTATQLKQRYNVTIQTTIVEVDAQGNLIHKVIAYDDPSLPAVLEALK